MPTSTFLSAATFTTRLWGDWGSESWVLIHSWSLSVEEQFYFLWPATLAFVRPGSGRRRIIVAAIILAVPVFRLLYYRFGDPILIEHLFLTQADAIMFGCLLALFLDSQRDFARRVFAYNPLLLRAVAVGLIYIPYIVLPRIVYICLNPSIQSCAIAYLIGSYVLIERWMSYRVLNCRVLRWVGILSYSLYIWQQLVLFPEEMPAIYWFQRFPQNLFFVFLFAIVSYYAIEQPFLAIKGRSRG